MPLGESFLSTLKSNKLIMLDKSRRFRKTKGSFDWSKSQQFNFPKATPEQLRQIKENIQRENKKVRIKTFLIFGILLFVIITIYLIQ